MPIFWQPTLLGSSNRMTIVFCSGRQLCVCPEDTSHLSEFGVISLILINLLGTLMPYHDPMENITQFLAPVPDPDSDVVVLRCTDPLHFDPSVLNRLFIEKDPDEVEEVVCRVLEDIAMRLDLLQQARSESDFARMLTPARRISTVAEQIGLAEVSVAADHVINCVQQMDGIALEATLARLERGFDIAVSEVWNYREL